MANSMDFPPSAKKKKYSDNVQTSNEYSLEVPNNYIAVPGHQGDRGQKGDKGDKGDKGEIGEGGETGIQGIKGVPGKNGTDGLDGKSVLSPSQQQIGWACYDDLNKNSILIGATRGEDGWVSLSVDGKGPETNENFLPKGSSSLWNPETRKINFKGMNIGSIITIRYNVEITTFSNNTEIWFRTNFGNSEQVPITYVGSLKYQFSYDLSVQQTIFLENRSMQILGGMPQVRSDNDASIILKSLQVSTS